MTKRIQIISFKIFVAAAINPTKETFVVYIMFLALKLKISICWAWADQMALLIAEKVAILAEYFDFVDIFSKKSADQLFKCANINKNIIDL